MSHKCELCGTPVRVVGETTMHYEPVKPEMSEKWREFYLSNFVADNANAEAMKDVIEQRKKLGVSMAAYVHVVEYAALETTRAEIERLTHYTKTLITEGAVQAAELTQRLSEAEGLIEKVMTLIQINSDNLTASFIIQWVSDYRNKRGETK